MLFLEKLVKITKKKNKKNKNLFAEPELNTD